MKRTSGNLERVNKDATMLVEKEAVKERWTEYFKGLLNVEEDRKAEIVTVGKKNGINMLVGLNNALIMEEEVNSVVKEMKTVGLDGCAIECLNSGSTSVIKWLVKLLNVYFVTSMVLVDLINSCVAPLYKIEDDKYECASFRGISLLSVVGKMYCGEGRRSLAFE